ncbi:hypothetical protein [Burkholderia ubonensis]|uniref:hypothetical protein n=1 Tax=Burkholderia ubonensis TaxID=101571 RepID=UPI000A778738|nr:hypothetical protein [Burkholderia ubonensis]
MLDNYPSKTNETNLPLRITSRTALTNASVKQMKFFFVRNIGTFVGRAIPVVGWAVAAHDVYAIATNSVARFNRLVNREDRLFTR